MRRLSPALAGAALLLGAGASAHDLGLPVGALLACAAEPSTVYAKVQLVDDARAHPTEGPLIHATLFDDAGNVVPHTAIYSHYFMNCRITDAAPPTPEGFEGAFEAWLDNGAAPALEIEPADIFARQALRGPS